jgi:hypothetical protein
MIKQIDLTYINQGLRGNGIPPYLGQNVVRERVRVGATAWLPAACLLPRRTTDFREMMDGTARSGAGLQRGRRRGHSAEGAGLNAESRTRKPNRWRQIGRSRSLCWHPCLQTVLYVQLTDMGLGPWGRGPSVEAQLEPPGPGLCTLYKHV